MRLRFVAVTVIFLASFSSIAQAKSFERKTISSSRTELGARLPVPVPSYLTEIIREASVKHSVDANLIAAVIFKESAFKTNAVSWRGAQGLMQLMPRTAQYVGVSDPFDARQNVLGGTKYLRKMLDTFDGNVELALAAYNAGPTAVKQKGPAATEEAVEYVAKIKTYL